MNKITSNEIDHVSHAIESWIGQNTNVDKEVEQKRKSLCERAAFVNNREKKL